VSALDRQLSSYLRGDTSLEEYEAAIEEPLLIEAGLAERCPAIREGSEQEFNIEQVHGAIFECGERCTRAAGHPPPHSWGPDRG
jgi:hypothetical protein